MGIHSKIQKKLRFDTLKGDRQEKKLIFQSDDGKSFNQEQAIDLLVSLVATDSNSEKKWRGFYNSLSSAELQDEWDEHWES